MKFKTNIFSIGPFTLSESAPPIFFAEIGGFFGQNVDLAKKLIDQVVSAGQQVPDQPLVLKGEVLHSAEICLPGDTLETYSAKDGRIYQENYRSLIERKVLPLSTYEIIFSACRGKEIPFVLSVYDFLGAEFAHDIGAAAIKIASSNLTHLPLVRHCAKMGLPMVIDTGRSSISEVYLAVDAAKVAGCHDIIIQHSPDGHPAAPDRHNLRSLQTYQRVFGLPVGLSDHHVGVEMLFMAIALGSSVLEKGVYFNPEDLDIDISHTMDIKDLSTVLRTVFQCWQALGNPLRDLREPIHGVLGTSQRQCLVAKRALVPGEKLDLELVSFAFPKRGIGVEYWDLVQGWVLRESIMAGEPICWRHIEARDI